MPISVHVLVLNSSRPWLRFASVSRKNGASTSRYCGCVGIGCASSDTATFGPAPSVDCDPPGGAASARTAAARTAIDPIRRMGASFEFDGQDIGLPCWLVIRQGKLDHWRCQRPRDYLTTRGSQSAMSGKIIRI